MDFTEGRLALKLDPSGGLLDSLIAVNERVFGAFSAEERARLGIHVCPGADRDSTHSADVDYCLLLPKLLAGLSCARFYLQLKSEADPSKALACVKVGNLLNPYFQRGKNAPFPHACPTLPPLSFSFAAY